MITVLFLCTGNSCRSIMAEGLLSHYGEGRFKAISGGSVPAGYVHPMSLETLTVHGIKTSGYFSKSWDIWHDGEGNITFPIDIVITVCDAAAGEACPLFPGKPIKVHWGVPDPAKFEGDEFQIREEFERVCTILERRVQALVALSLETMKREQWQSAIQKIGTML
ncbi:MAG: Protein-tyrosine phosphatase, low molecular weight [Rickettsiales bacterium]|jgi:arsenate reductase|nr:Protein-tyrosine phosphatase, low molecular weight [Rickettsiales bacterium]